MQQENEIIEQALQILETRLKYNIGAETFSSPDDTKRFLKLKPAAVILAHNHPSGVAEPSRADEQITRRLKEALELVEIRVLDHLIVGSEITSMAERGLV